MGNSGKRRVMIAGNWKMWGGITATNDYMQALEQWLEQDIVGRSVMIVAMNKRMEIVIAPPFTSLAYAALGRKTDLISIAAQNVHYEATGAFTGEISLDMLTETRCDYVILAHSERRHVFAEPEDLLEKKLRATLNSKINPIYCIGEQLVERETGNMENVLKGQLESALKRVKPEELAERVVIAYEPVWAIGTGRTASKEDAQFSCQYIRGLVEKGFGPEVASKTRILYGGSVKPENSAELLAQPDIDGLLVGGASLDPASFGRILATGAAL